MREIAHDIRESLWRDFKDRIEDAELMDDFIINESLMSAIYVPTGNILLSKGFKKSSGKQTAKLKSIAGATHVAIEEAEEISESDFKQLDDSLRTTKGQIQIIQIFNPPSKNHWLWARWYNLIESDVPGYYKAVQKSGQNLLSIFSTYLDNLKNLNESFIKNLESYTDEYFYTMVLGLISEGLRGRIYKKWKIGDMPGMYTKFYGLDFGFNDPVALVECESHNQKLWLDEKIYASEMTNDELSKKMEDYGISKSAVIYADSSEPKDITDLQRMGWNVIAAKKGPGSVLAGIRFINKYEVFATERSSNLWYENQNYKWRLDQNKLPLDEPEDRYNHIMDAINYAMDYERSYTSGPSLSFHR